MTVNSAKCFIFLTLWKSLSFRIFSEAVAPRTEKNHQKSNQCFWTRRKFATKWYITLI